MPGVVMLLVIVGVVAVLFVAAVVATQDTDPLAEAPPDDADVELPPGRVVAEDLRAVRFGMVFRGYRMSEVDEVLDRLANELRERDERTAELERALAEVLEPVVAEAEAQQASGDVTDAPPAGPDVPLPEREVPRRDPLQDWQVEEPAAALAPSSAAPEESPEEPPGHHRALDLATSFALGTPAAEVVLPEPAQHEQRAEDAADVPPAQEVAEPPALDEPVPAIAEAASEATTPEASPEPEPTPAWWSPLVSPSGPRAVPASQPDPDPVGDALVEPPGHPTDAPYTTPSVEPERLAPEAAVPEAAAPEAPVPAPAEPAPAEPAPEAAQHALELSAPAEDRDERGPAVPEPSFRAEPAGSPEPEPALVFEPAPPPSPPASGDALLPPAARTPATAEPEEPFAQEQAQPFREAPGVPEEDEDPGFPQVARADDDEPADGPF